MAESETKKCGVNELVMKQIKEQIEKIQYGSVTVVVHGGKIVQVDTNAKIRLI